MLSNNASTTSLASSNSETEIEKQWPFISKKKHLETAFFVIPVSQLELFKKLLVKAVFVIIPKVYILQLNNFWQFLSKTNFWELLMNNLVLCNESCTIWISQTCLYADASKIVETSLFISLTVWRNLVHLEKSKCFSLLLKHLP